MTNEIRIFDMHCDTLDRLAWPALPASLNCGEWIFAPGDAGTARQGVLQDFATSAGQLSLRGMSERQWAQCMAVFIPDELSQEQSAEFFGLVSATLAAHADAHPDMLEVATDARLVDGVLLANKTCALLTIENGKLLASSDDMFDTVARAGVKMVTLTWNAKNPLGSGHDTEDGLTSFGRRAVRELETRRIVVDVSHLNDPGFNDVAAIARRPFAASHSNSRTVCDVPRNLTDDQFRAIRDSGGVVGLNFCNGFLSLERADPTIDDVLSHVEHWLDLDGQDVVALGTDYDGTDVPSWLSSCERIPALSSALEDRFGRELTEKLLFDNAHDFFVRNETC